MTRTNRFAQIVFIALISTFIPAGCTQRQRPDGALLLRAADNQPKDYPRTRGLFHMAEAVEKAIGGITMFLPNPLFK